MRTHNPTRTAVFAAMLGASGLAAQNIEAYQYWFDDDVEGAITTTVAGAPTFELDTPIEADALSAGFHKITIRFRDSNNAWSVITERYFSKSGKDMNAYRYWFDDDVANATTTSVVLAPSLALDQTINTGSLSVGTHKISMEFRNGDGSWSTLTERYFTKGGANLTAWQYWFDDNVGGLVETAAGPNSVINVATDIDASALADGTHNITWRMKDALGSWSVPVSQDFDVVTGIAEIPGLERAILFPNPADDLVQVRFDGAGAEFNFDVLDAIGRTVMPARRAVLAGTAIVTLDLNGLGAGTYHLRLIGPERAKDILFVKR